MAVSNPLARQAATTALPGVGPLLGQAPTTPPPVAAPLLGQEGSYYYFFPPFVRGVADATRWFDSDDDNR
jgi:hypothetical protein